MIWLALALMFGSFLLAVWALNQPGYFEDEERLRVAVRDLMVEIGKTFLLLVHWLDRQLQRWPRLYAWFSR